MVYFEIMHACKCHFNVRERTSTCPKAITFMYVETRSPSVQFSDLESGSELNRGSVSLFSSTLQSDSSVIEFESQSPTMRGNISNW